MNASLAAYAAATLAVIGAAGCEQSKWPKRTPLSLSTATAINEIAAQQNESNDIAASSFNGESWGIGTVPWNSTILPLLSPNGQWIATSTGVPPSKSTQLALPNAPVPMDSIVEIWEVLTGRGGIRAQNTISGSIVLTNTADDEGFLIESPQADGSRWIGKINWRTGDLKWLVQDDRINTMPSLGPNGRLAWCVRTTDEMELSLAIRFSDDREFLLPPSNGEWLLPMWSSRGTRLSAWLLGSDNVLSLVSLNGRSPDTLGVNLKQVLIMNGANRWDAIRATANRVAVQGLRPPLHEEVVFYHPIKQRMAVWIPLGLNADQVTPLATGSIDAVHDRKGNFLLTMPKGLHWQDISDLKRIVRVDHVPLYARPTNDPMRPFVLLDPGTHLVRVRGMRPTAPRTRASR